jgi:hypothetical protein
MIFPVVLSFDKKIAFGKPYTHKTSAVVAVVGNNGDGKKSIFPLVGYDGDSVRVL